MWGVCSWVGGVFNFLLEVYIDLFDVCVMCGDFVIGCKLMV